MPRQLYAFVRTREKTPESKRRRVGKTCWVSLPELPHDSGIETRKGHGTISTVRDPSTRRTTRLPKRMKTSLREHKTDKDFGPLFSGELLRDEALEQVSSHNGKWMELCIKEAQYYVRTSLPISFTGEDLRFHCQRAVGCPAHSNAWGALINTLVRRKIIKPTGEWRKMRDSSSHARRTPVYTK